MTRIAPRQLKRLLSRRDAYRILDSTSASGGTWLSGGCGLLAVALQRLLPDSTLIGVFEGPVLHHVAVRYCGRLVDADGVTSSDYGMTLRWLAQEGLREAQIRDISLEDLRAQSAIPSDENGINAVAGFLRASGVPSEIST